MTLADQYYIKAMDDYPYNLNEAMESLHYALSYDENHVRANFLMGRAQYETFANFEEAEYYFNKTIQEDPKLWMAYDWYSHMLIRRKQFSKAEKIIDFASTLKDAEVSSIHYKRGLIAETKEKLKKAEKLFEKAMLSAPNSGYLNFYRDEQKRIKEKRKLAKKSK